MLSFLYRGFVIAGNIGDDILFFIFCKMVSIVMKKYRTIDDISFIHGFKLTDYDVEVLGGGSIIHPLETQFTNFNFKKILFINGTGTTDCNIIDKKIIKMIDNDSIIDEISTYKDDRMSLNCNNILKMTKKFGGVRGIYEKKVYRNHTNNDISVINDIGILASILHKNTTIKIDSHGRKIVLVNPIKIGGVDALKDENMTYEEYNAYIDKVLIDFSLLMINDKSFFVYIADFTNNRSEYYYNKIQGMLTKENKKYVGYFNVTNNFENSLSVIKQSYIVIGTRLHTNIIANSFDIPTISIAYGVKHINYNITNNLNEFYVPTYTKYLTVSKLNEIMDNIVNNYSKIKYKISTIRENTYSQYFHEIDNLLSMFYNKDLSKKISIKYGIMNSIFAGIDIKDIE